MRSDAADANRKSLRHWLRAQNLGIERFRRVDFGHMTLSVTIDDPKAYLAPWTIDTTLTLMPDADLMEAFCENQDRILQHTRIDPAPPEPHSPPVRETRP